MVSEIPSAFVEITDSDLVCETLAGNRSAFNELIKRYQRRATAVAYRLLGNLQDALEIAQEAFLKAFTNLPSLQKAEAFGAWLMRIVSNLSLNFRRVKKTRQSLQLDDLSPSAASFETEPTQPLQDAEAESRVGEALNRLPARQKAAIVSFALEEIPQKQIAQALGCSTQAVKWHVFEARRKLKEFLRDYL